jgi:hypothetical protein
MEVMQMTARYQVSPFIQKVLRERNLTAEDVLRKALNIKPEGLDAGDGVIFPEGTAFLKWYKERPYWGHVRDGAFEMEGEKFSSLSGAAAKITGRPTTNGWDFWMVKIAGKNEFVQASSFRKPA